MTAFEFVCIKDLEVEGRTIKEITILRATYKSSSIKNDCYPSDDFLDSFKALDYDSIKRYLN